MSHYKKIFLLRFSLVASFFLLACSDPFTDAYRSASDNLSDDSTRTYARSGSLKITEKNLIYKMDSSSVTAEEFHSLDTARQRLLLQKLLLRRLIIERGIKEKIYNDQQAIKFLLGTLEEALEEYYMHKKSEGVADPKKIMPDQDTIAEFSGQTGSNQALNTNTLQNIARAYSRMKENQKKKQIIERILESSPPLEILQ